MKLVFDIPNATVGGNWVYYDVIAEPANRGTMLGIRNTNRNIQGHFYRSGETSLVLLEEDFKMIQSGVVFKKFSPFLETYNEMLGWMEAFGFIEFWRQKYVYFSSMSKVEDIGPQVLTMDHLRIGFLACVIPLGLAVLIFIAELLKSKLSWNRESIFRKMQQMFYCVVPFFIFLFVIFATLFMSGMNWH